MSDELRERVAMVNCAGDQWDKPCKVPCVDCLREADAAIALVLEEAARVAEYRVGAAEWSAETNSGYECAAREIAAAIRALREKA